MAFGPPNDADCGYDSTMEKCPGGHFGVVALSVWFMGCSSPAQAPDAHTLDSATTDAAPTPDAARQPTLAAEPAATTMGVGQRIDAWAVLRDAGPFPQYLQAEAQWTSAQPNVVTVVNGKLQAIAPGTSTISVRYQNLTAQVAVTVAGTMTERNFAVAGQGTRSYSVYMPAAGVSPRPLLIAMHGGGGNAAVAAATTQLNTLAQARGMIVVYPNGTGAIQTFNAGACCGTAQAQGIDDVAFIRALLDDISTREQVDQAKLFATGFSNGGMMAHRLACGLSDRIAGIVAVGGGSAEYDFIGTRYFTCTPSRPVPVMHIHASNDRNYPIAGGRGAGLSDTNFYPIANGINDWLQRNNLTSEFTERQAAPSTVCRHYSTPRAADRLSAPVAYCISSPPDVFDATNEIVYGGGHAWPGGVRSPSGKADTPLQDFSASAELARFLLGF